jgi:hypothetical protein
VVWGKTIAHNYGVLLCQEIVLQDPARPGQRPQNTEGTRKPRKDKNLLDLEGEKTKKSNTGTVHAETSVKKPNPYKSGFHRTESCSHGKNYISFCTDPGCQLSKLDPNHH